MTGHNPRWVILDDVPDQGLVEWDGGKCRAMMPTGGIIPGAARLITNEEMRAGVIHITPGERVIIVGPSAGGGSYARPLSELERAAAFVRRAERRWRQGPAS